VDVYFRHIDLPRCVGRRTIAAGTDIERHASSALSAAQPAALSRHNGVRARFMRSPRPSRGTPPLRGWSGCTAALGQGYCFFAVAISLRSPTGKGGKLGGGSVMELRTESPRKYVQTRLVNHCAQCGETIFLPEWSEYMDRQRVRHLWECEACGYKFETLVSFPDP
jgi:ribosomal protein L37AE/L43A